MTTNGNIGNIRPIKIEEEMRTSYLDYAMSVIVSRALPSAQDGLKPVQRRILYAMHTLGLRPASRYRKSAGIVGEVLKSFHPHGDDPVYEAMVRMAQDFSLRYPLVDGQGNFGSVDNDPPAAMRYTEVRLAPIAEELLANIDRDTVDLVPNYDDSLKEPVVLPARLPNLLVNGASGIAVGMATNIPPHNLNEICDGVKKLIDQPDTTTDELADIVKGPDFPTGGIVYRMRREHEYDAEGKRKDVTRDALRQTYADGRGRIIVQARTTIEESARGNRMQIIVSELPYQVNKAALIERIANLVRNKRIDGISDLRDESDRHGMRIVIELSRTGQARQVLNALYKHTPMQSTFPVNMLALVNGQPRVINLKTALEQFITFRREVIRRRTAFDLERAKEREHIVQGLLKAISDLDRVIKTIRAAASAEKAREALQAEPFDLTERQAQAVLDLQLRRLARLEREKLEEEHKELIKLIGELEDLLRNPRKIDFLIKQDASELQETYGDQRRTEIVAQEAEQFTDEDLIAHQEVVVTLSSRGYTKRLPLETYRPQRRGGRGITGMVTREEDAVHRLIVADTHDSLLFFTNRGRVFQLKVFDVPEASRQARGIPLINLIDMDQQERVTAVVPAREFQKDYLVVATALGEIKKTPLSDFSAVRRAGLIAMDLEKGDVLVAAKLAHEDDEVIVVTSDGKALRYSVEKVPQRSRAAGGVRAVKLGKGARLASLEVIDKNRELLTITQHGYGKRTAFSEYTPHGRATAGQLTYHITKKTGPVVLSRTVDPAQELIVISQEGIVLRTRVESIRKTGRAAQGVSVINVGEGDAVASVSTIDMESKQEPAQAQGPDDTPPPAGGAGAGKKPTKINAPRASRKASSKPIAKRTAPKPKKRTATKAAKKPVAKRMAAKTSRATAKKAAKKPSAKRAPAKAAKKATAKRSRR